MWPVRAPCRLVMCAAAWALTACATPEQIPPVPPVDAPSTFTEASPTTTEPPAFRAPSRAFAHEPLMLLVPGALPPGVSWTATSDRLGALPVATEPRSDHARVWVPGLPRGRDGLTLTRSDGAAPTQRREIELVTRSAGWRLPLGPPFADTITDGLRLMRAPIPVGDLDGDGVDEVLLSSCEGRCVSPRMTVTDPGAAVGARDLGSLGCPAVPGDPWPVAPVPDANGDGLPELFVRDQVAAHIVIYAGGPCPLSGEPLLTVTEVPSISHVRALPDGAVWVSNLSSVWAISAAQLHEGGTLPFEQLQALQLILAGTKSTPLVADVDGDGRLDAASIVRDGGTGEDVLAVHRPFDPAVPHPLDPFRAQEWLYPWPDADSIDEVHPIGDPDGDGAADLFVDMQPGDGRVVSGRRLADATDLMQASVRVPLRRADDLADVDADGVPDLVGDESMISGARLSRHLRDAGFIDAPPEIAVRLLTSGDARAADVDGDGLVDLMIQVTVDSLRVVAVLRHPGGLDRPFVDLHPVVPGSDGASFVVDAKLAALPLSWQLWVDDVAVASGATGPGRVDVPVVLPTQAVAVRVVLTDAIGGQTTVERVIGAPVEPPVPPCADSEGTCVDGCTDGLDNDGDALLDCEDADCVGVCVEVCDGGEDEDGDALIDCADDDCLQHPGCGRGRLAWVSGGTLEVHVQTEFAGDHHGHWDHLEWTATARNVRGWLRDAQEGGWTTCAWSVDRASFAAAWDSRQDSGSALAYGSGEIDTFTSTTGRVVRESWFGRPDKWRERQWEVQRHGFRIDPGCGVSSSGFLPRFLRGLPEYLDTGTSFADGPLPWYRPQPEAARVLSQEIRLHSYGASGSGSSSWTARALIPASAIGVCDMGEPALQRLAAPRDLETAGLLGVCAGDGANE